MLNLSSQNKVPFVSHSPSNVLAGTQQLGLSSRPTRITKLTTQGSDGHLTSLQLSAGRTGWPLGHCQRLLLGYIDNAGEEEALCSGEMVIRLIFLTSPVGLDRHFWLLAEDHPPERPDHHPGSRSSSDSGKCLKMTGRLCEPYPCALFRGSWTQLCLPFFGKQ